MHLKKLSNDQSGLAAIIVTMIIMFVLTITVISFATTSQRNARQSLDRQLNTQAYYAAESGINDALAVINANIASGSPVIAQTNCNASPSVYPAPPATTKIDAAHNVEYTCLLVDPSPSQLEKTINVDHSAVIPLKTTPGTASYFELNWNDPNYDSAAGISGSCPTILDSAVQPNFPAASRWNCNVSGVLRVDIVDMGGGTIDRSGFTTKTFFIYPVNNGASPATNSIFSGAGISNGSVVAGICSNAVPACNFRMDLAADRQYYMRIRAIYNSAILRIVAPDTTGTNLPFVGSQATIDATGKAQDVLRRVKVNVPLGGIYNFPDFAIQTNNSICKTLTLTNNTINFTGLAPAPDGVAGGACDPTGP